MELYKEIILKLIEKEEVQIMFPNLNVNITEVINTQCYKALEKIRDIIQDSTLDDKECFMKIEKIVCLLEDIGSNGNERHDFG